MHLYDYDDILCVLCTYICLIYEYDDIGPNHIQYIT